MVLKLPNRFDENEWLVILGFVTLLFIFIISKKQFPTALTFLFLLLTAYLAMSVDFILATKFSYDFYDAMDISGYNLFDFFMTNFNYSLIGYLFIHYYDKLQVSGARRVSYILFWLVVALVLETICVKLHVYTYHNWNLAYSSIAYLIIFFFYILFLKIGKHTMTRA
ncbi:hypothetical protein ACLM5H_21025 [Fredinandcohnia humi]